MARVRILLVAQAIVFLVAGSSANRVARELVGVSSIYGRVKTLEGQLEGELRKPKGMHPETKHWWTSNEEQLTAALADAEDRYRVNLKLRSANSNLRSFLRDKKSSNQQDQLFMDGLFTATFPCPAEFRLGNWVDGGKWVCMSHFGALKPQVPVVLSIGCRGETSFEAAVFRELGAHSYGVDFSLTPEVSERVNALPYITLNEVGLCGTRDMTYYTRRYPGVKWVSIFDILADVKAQFIDIFKIDCEGCEYGVIADLVDHFTRSTVPFGQIQMEIHLVGDNPGRTFEALARLEDLGYRLFHTEINRFSDKTKQFHYEIALIHENLVRPKT